MSIKYINQSRQTVSGPPEAKTNVIGRQSADIYQLMSINCTIVELFFFTKYFHKEKQNLFQSLK